MRPRSLIPSPAMIVALLALIISMSAGAYAAVIAPKNSVVSKSIKNGQVKTKDLKANAVKAGQIADGSVGSADIADGSVGSADIADGAIGLGDLSAAAKTDLNNSDTLGGLTVAQIVAAAGGKYAEARQTGSADIETPTAQNIVSLELAAGKYLINVKVPVYCYYSGAGAPANPAPNQPFFGATGHLVVGGSTVESASTTCEAEAMADASLFGSDTYYGQSVVEITRQVTLAATTTITLRANGTNDGILFGVGIVADRINANTSGSMIQAITINQ
jgi:hypothetical protein